jgi:ABC-type polysaccharide/polyol phosphate transport system ATPase subunit
VLELGSGFHRDLDGIENAIVYASAMGMTPAEVRGCLPSVIDFSALREDIALPLKHFSTGMQARLALSVALCSGFELLLLDEALSVCDRPFREKAEARLMELRAEGSTYVFVSHDVQQVQRLCDRVVWMQEGQIHADGPASTILERYRTSS